ncbi:MAG: hypothetical protein GY895_15040 [Phycisphaera sp.]|nr:hypothetical protein [Phycisphaera sp.]
MDATSSNSPVDSSDHFFCLGCGYQLDEDASPHCSECGRPFDRSNSRTMGRSSTSGARRRNLGLALRGLIILLAIFLLVEITILFFGYDPLAAFLLGVPALPFMGAAILLALIPSLDAKPSTRVLAILLPLLIIFTASPWLPGMTHPAPNWPFRVSFFFHRAAIDRLASEVRATDPPPTQANIGLLEVIDIQFIDPKDPDGSNLGLQLSGDGGGGVHLVQIGPNATFIWWNTNWEIDLGGGWYLVDQD